MKEKEDNVTYANSHENLERLTTILPKKHQASVMHERSQSCACPCFLFFLYFSQSLIHPDLQRQAISARQQQLTTRS
jgi:hypothetical protein